MIETSRRKHKRVVPTGHCQRCGKATKGLYSVRYKKVLRFGQWCYTHYDGTDEGYEWIMVCWDCNPESWLGDPFGRL